MEAYSLVPMREEDIFSIMKWRNDQIDVLRQKKPLSEEDQREYYDKIVVPSFTKKEPEILLFSYLLKDRCVGYGGLTYIDWSSRRAEVSFLLETERTKDLQCYEKDFTAFLKLLKKVAFEDLSLHRLFTETFDIRPLHVAISEKNGFVLEGRLRQHNLIHGKYVDALIHGCLSHES